MEYTAWIESTALSTWLRESISLLAFPTVLIVHAIGMGLLAGMNTVMDLRILGVAPKVPLSLLERFFPVMWFGLAINVVSGIFLFIAYPTKAATNPIFYLKLGCIAAGILLTLRIRDKVIRVPSIDFGNIPASGRSLAVVSLILWAGAITSGRLLAYTCRYLMANSRC
jgi:hypothetical protein